MAVAGLQAGPPLLAFFLMDLLPHLVGVFCGSGVGGMSSPFVTAHILSLLPPNSKPRVLYLGTATYDDSGKMEAQTAPLRAAGCEITSLALCPTATDSAPAPTSAESAAAAFAAAQVILVSGGNSLYMIDLWKTLGVDALIRAAVARGAIFCGGSAGLGFLFTGIHSDSADPATFRAPAPPGADASSWQYIRVPALEILPGLCCPHYDQVQSNGVLRAVDAAEMLKRHRGERMLCVDHWAALKVEGGGKFSVLSLPGKQRSPEVGGGEPRVAIIDVTEGGALQEQVLPRAGQLQDWLRRAAAVTQDPAVEQCRRDNPIS